MANIAFLGGTLEQYQGLATKNANTLYFLTNGHLYKGDKRITGSVEVVDTYPSVMENDVLYICSADKSMKFNGVEIEPSIVSSIVVDAEHPENNTAADRLATVGAIKAYIEAQLANIPEAVDYTVELTDETAGENEYSKQTLTQASIEGDDKTVGTIVVPKVTMTTDTSDSSVKKYTFKQGATEIGTVNIPADMVVEDAEVVKVTEEQAGTEGYPASAGTYLKFSIANKDDDLWVDVKDLANEYGVVTGVTNGIQLALSEDNKFSATIVGQVIAEANLAEDLATKINAADEGLTWGTIA